MLEIRVLAASLYRNFEVERVGKPSDVTEEFAFTLFPKNLRVRLRRRTPGARADSARAPVDS